MAFAIALLEFDDGQGLVHIQFADAGATVFQGDGGGIEHQDLDCQQLLGFVNKEPLGVVQRGSCR